MSNKKILGFGEVMLRLCPPGFQRLRQCLPGGLDATFGGGEANVCASATLLGSTTAYLTALPDNAVAHSFLAQMRGIGVDVSSVLLKPNTRMGIYYVEAGANQRASNVIYDRNYSAISLTGPEEYDFDTALQNVAHVHVTGITPALSQKAFDSTLELVRQAKKIGAWVSCDLNYRKKLWDWHPDLKKTALAEHCMNQIVPYVDLVIANEEDASDVFGIQAENTSITHGRLEGAAYQEVARKLVERFDNIKYVAITLRESISASHNNWGAMLYDRSSEKAFFCTVGRQRRIFTPSDSRYCRPGRGRRFFRRGVDPRTIQRRFQRTP